MQLELMCAEETLRGYEQRIAAHAERERIIRLYTSPPCEQQNSSRAAREKPLAAVIKTVARWLALLRWTGMPRRKSPWTALS